MIVGVSPALASLLCALALAGCADETIRLTYTPPAPSQSLGPRLVIGSFRDVRGNEGDHGDAYRVGGVYGGYANRLAKVMSAAPWPPALTSALAAEFRALGVARRRQANRRQESGYNLNNFKADILEELLNQAFARFAREVAADAEIRGALR
jgi:hypothetical protein